MALTEAQLRDNGVDEATIQRMKADGMVEGFSPVSTQPASSGAQPGETDAEARYREEVAKAAAEAGELTDHEQRMQDLLAGLGPRDEPVIGDAEFYSNNDPFAALRGKVKTWLGDFSESLGFERFVLGETFETDWSRFLSWASPMIADETDYWNLVNSEPGGLSAPGEGSFRSYGETQIGGKINPYSAEGLDYIYSMAQMWAATEYGIDPNLISQPTSRGPGSRLPTEEEIRQQFDIDHLTEVIKSMGRGALVEEFKGARALANSYVNAIVATRGQQEIDFGTFVTKHFKGTARWKQIYRNKPEGMEPEAYIAPYIAAASQALGGGMGQNGYSDIVAGGAALGSTGADFAARLQKTDAVQNQSGFISKLESAVSGISNFLRG
jgi:hypothetical protein